MIAVVDKEEVVAGKGSRESRASVVAESENNERREELLKGSSPIGVSGLDEEGLINEEYVNGCNSETDSNFTTAVVLERKERNRKDVRKR